MYSRNANESSGNTKQINFSTMDNVLVNDAVFIIGAECAARGPLN